MFVSTTLYMIAGSDWSLPQPDVTQYCAGNRSPTPLFEQQPIGAVSSESVAVIETAMAPAPAGAPPFFVPCLADDSNTV